MLLISSTKQKPQQRPKKKKGGHARYGGPSGTVRIKERKEKNVVKTALNECKRKTGIGVINLIRQRSDTATKNKENASQRGTISTVRREKERSQGGEGKSGTQPYRYQFSVGSPWGRDTSWGHPDSPTKGRKRKAEVTNQFGKWWST